MQYLLKSIILFHVFSSCLNMSNWINNIACKLLLFTMIIYSQVLFCSSLSLHASMLIMNVVCKFFLKPIFTDKSYFIPLFLNMSKWINNIACKLLLITIFTHKFHFFSSCLNMSNWIDNIVCKYYNIYWQVLFYCTLFLLNMSNWINVVCKLFWYSIYYMLILFNPLLFTCLNMKNWIN